MIQHIWISIDSFKTSIALFEVINTGETVVCCMWPRSGTGDHVCHVTALARVADDGKNKVPNCV